MTLVFFFTAKLVGASGTLYREWVGAEAKKAENVLSPPWMASWEQPADLSRERVAVQHRRPRALRNELACFGNSIKRECYNYSCIDLRYRAAIKINVDGVNPCHLSESVGGQNKRGVDLTEVFFNFWNKKRLVSTCRSLTRQFERPLLEFLLQWPRLYSWVETFSTQYESLS